MMRKYDVKKIYEWPAPARGVIIGLICIMIFVMSYSWNVSDMRTRLGDLQDQEKSLLQQIVLTNSKKINASKDVSLLPKLKELLDEWKLNLVNRTDLPDSLNEILRIGGNNKIQFNLFNPGDEEKEGLYFKIPIQIEALGSYDEIGNFISHVANMQKMVIVDDFSLRKNDKAPAKPDTSGTLLKVLLKLNVYLVPNKVVDDKAT